MIKTEKISKFFKKLLKALENHLGLVILIIFAIVILYATWLFYNFVYKSISTEPKISFQKTEIEKTVFERVKKQIDLREKNILEAMGKEYKDIFE